MWIVMGGMILLGLLLLTLSLRHTVQIAVDDQLITRQTFALRTQGALRQAGIKLSNGDQVNPPLEKLFYKPPLIQVTHAYDYTLVTRDGSPQVNTVDRIPANILAKAGFIVFPHDRVLINGAEIDPNLPIDPKDTLVLQFQQALPLSVSIDGNQRTLYSSQPTVGMALAESGIVIHPKDTVSIDLDTALSSPTGITILKAREVAVIMNDQTFSGLSSALTVGEALKDLGISLQGLDYANPPEDSPLPANRQIQLTRVQETLSIVKVETPYTNSYQPDPNTELDQGSVIQPGQVGLAITRSRIKYANGVEVNRQSDPSWKASDPREGILGYGTQVVTRTEIVDGQALEYWRKITVYATSYSPCKQGYSYCTTATASGVVLQKGIVAVLPSWYRAMKFQSVYIPGYGYGSIADTGGGIPGRNWIDLGFGEEDYESWHFWTTMYFLTPVPAYIPYLLP